MKILIVNPIMYTSETRNIKRADTIKDTMIYDLCLGFMKLGHSVTLAAGDDYRPEKKEEYPFEVKWLDMKLKKLCVVNAIPFCPGVISLAKKGNFDLIISSEVLSLNSFMLSLCASDKLIVWHELAKHLKIMRQIPSKLWYTIVARIFFRKALIVPRSIEAKDFVSQYCKNVTEQVIDHGVNLDQFTACDEKENYFAVSARLAPKKRIDKIINAFSLYLKKYDSTAKLCIMGDGEEEENLKDLVKSLDIEKSVVFTGRLNHSELVGKLKKAKAMLVYTEMDNNMLSIVESIAVGTPVITNTVPNNASYIRKCRLGIVDDCWNEDTLNEVASNKSYIKNCLDYRTTLSTESKAQTFIDIYKNI